MKKRWIAVVLAGVMAFGVLTGCGGNKSKGLDPDNPVSLMVWHYYNGAQQAAFDELVSEFNATTGKDMGIYVEGQSKGSVSDLEQAVTDSLNGVVGAGSLPDIFSTYADTAYSVQQQGMLADLNQYFTADELSEYVDSYIEEGYIGNDVGLYVFPVAKSTEVMMMNKTEWDEFAKETGAKLEDLETTEGVCEVAKQYYEWTDAKTPDIPDDGKAFYGRDSMSNYFILGMKQMGTDIFDVKNGEVTICADKEQMKRLWECYYVPYVEDYFAANGKFRSDDVKTGDIICYTGSSSSAMYFPDTVELDDESKPIDYIVLPAPIMEDGEKINVQQGAGMAVRKSDETREYAASVFLKWFTQKDNNLRFVCDSAYLPVLKEANTTDALENVIKENDLQINDIAHSCLDSILSSYDEMTFYTSKSFRNGYETRKVLDYNLSDKAAADKASIDEEVANGKSRTEAVKPYITDEAFEQWYEDCCKALNEAASES